MSEVKVITSIDQVSDLLKENNIELVSFNHSTFYDICLSQHYFEDFKNEWSDQSLWFGDRNSDYIVFFANKDLMEKSYYKISELRKMKKSELFELNNKFDFVAHWEDEKEYKKSDLIDNLMGVTNTSFYENHYDDTSFYDLDYDFDITGYSQGDKILIKKVGTEKEFLDCEKCQLIDSESLTNLFYDSVKCLKVDCFVNNELFEEIDLIEFIDMYSYYEKSECIDVLNKHYKDFKYFDLLLKYVESNFPKTLNYI